MVMLGFGAWLRHEVGVLSAVAAVVLVPPVNLAALALVAVLFGRRRLAGWSLVLLLLLALPLVSVLLLRGLESWPPPPPPGAAPQAVVILGGDVRRVDGAAIDVAGPLSLERLQAGAALARATHLPILVTGGLVDPEGPPVATLMAKSLAADFASPPRWVEPASRDTWENARFTAAMLLPAGIRTVYVVTHSWHMRRALLAFAGTGLAAIPAPLPPDRAITFHIGLLVPRVAGWRNSYFALHEWIGLAWYELRRAVG